MPLDITPFLEEFEYSDDREHINTSYFRITKVAHMTPRQDVAELTRTAREAKASSERHVAEPPKNTTAGKTTGSPNVTVGSTSFRKPAPKKPSRKRSAAQISLECDEDLVEPLVGTTDMSDAAPASTFVQSTGCTLHELYDVDFAQALHGGHRVEQLV